MRRWYAVHTQPQAEGKAEFNLRRQGFEVYCPRLRKQRRHARRIDTVLTPLFPRYLFTALDVDEQPWRAINGTFGVVHLVGCGERPTPGSHCRARASRSSSRQVRSSMRRARPSARVPTGTSSSISPGVSSRYRWRSRSSAVRGHV